MSVPTSQEGRRVADFGRFWPIWRLKLVAMATSLERSRKEYQIEQVHPLSTNPENLVKVGLVGSVISLLHLKKEEKKESNRCRI